MASNTEVVKDERFTFPQFVTILAKKWRLFLTTFLVIFSLAILYLLSASKVYTSTSEILIKDPTYGKGATSVSLDNLGTGLGRANIDNEIAYFSSIDLMAGVVKELHLNEVYSIRKGLRKVELYKTSPLTITLLEEPDPRSSFSFKFKLEKNGDVVLYNFKRRILKKKEHFDYEIRGKAGSEVKTPVGRFMLTRNLTPEAAEFIGKTISFNWTNIKSAAESLSKRLTVESASQKGTLIDLKVKASTQAKANEILTELIRQYNYIWYDDKHQIAAATSNFISNRLVVIEKELGNVDQDISDYKSSILTPNIYSASELLMRESADVQSSIMSLSNQISLAEFIRSELTKDNITEPLPTNIGLNDSGLGGQIAEYNAQVLSRNRLLSTLGENNPSIIERGQQIMTLRQNLLHSADNYVKSLRTRLQGLNAQNSTYNAQLAASPGKAKSLLSVERQQKVKENLYLFLLQKREENEIGQAFTTQNTAIIEAPHGKDLPTGPRALLILGAAFILSMLFPTLYIYFKLLFNRTVNTKSDLSDLKVPYLGDIPFMGSKRRFFKNKKGATNMPTVDVRKGGTSEVDEAMRVLRNNLEFYKGRKNRELGKVIMLVSANPGSGKTFVTINLGAVLAIQGKKVLLVDVDLRKGTLSRIAGSPRTGISKQLADEHFSSEDIIRDVDGIPGLDLLPSGVLPPNPTELLYSDYAEELMESLRKEYDYILLDCPPVDLVADSQIISRLADMTIYVMRAGLFDKQLLPAVQTYYEDKKFNNMCIVLNGVKRSEVYGKHAYGYGYGNSK